MYMAAAAEEEMDKFLAEEFESPSPKKDSPLKFPSPPKGSPIIQRQSLKPKRTLKQKRSIYPEHSEAIEKKQGEQLAKDQLDAIELYFDEAQKLGFVEPEVAFDYLIKEVKPTNTIIWAIRSAKVRLGLARKRLLAKGTKKRKPRKPKRTRKRPKTKKKKKKKTKTEKIKQDIKGKK